MLYIAVTKDLDFNAFSLNAIVDVRLRQSAVTKWFLEYSQKLPKLYISKFNTAWPSIHRKWCYQLLPVGSSSYKRVHFWSHSGREFSIPVHWFIQQIMKKFTVLKTVIQGRHFVCCNIIDILLLDSENGAQVGQPSSTHHTHGWFWFCRKLLKLAASKINTTKPSVA